MFIFFLCFAGKERKRTKRKKLGIIKKHSKYFQNKFCIHSISFQAVKIYFKNKLCLIKITTAKPYYAFGVKTLSLLAIGMAVIKDLTHEAIFEMGNHLGMRLLQVRDCSAKS